MCGENSLVRVCMGKSLVCIGYVSHLLYVGLVYRVGYLVSKVFIGKVVYPPFLLNWGALVIF